MYIITGVNGVGKSTVMPSLRKLLPEQYVIHDFDERGVPDGADRTWRMNELKQWIEVFVQNAKKGLSTVICGFSKTDDFDEIDVENVLEIRLILLHADPETVRERLENRYTKDGVFDETQKVIGKPVTEFIEGNVWFSNKMFEEFKENNEIIIDTNNITPEEVSGKIADILLSDNK